MRIHSGGQRVAGRDVAVATALCLPSHLGCTVLHMDGENLPAFAASDA